MRGPLRRRIERLEKRNPPAYVRPEPIHMALTREEAAEVEGILIEAMGLEWYLSAVAEVEAARREGRDI